MQTVWVKGLKASAKEARIKEVLGYKNAFDALKEILEQEVKKKPSVRDYDVPNWETRQVAVNEYNQAIDDLIKLITLEKE